MVGSVKDFDFSQLSAAERIHLAQELWDSVCDTQSLPFTAEQIAEIERRTAAFDSGIMPAYPWEEVKQRLSQRKPA